MTAKVLKPIPSAAAAIASHIPAADTDSIVTLAGVTDKFWHITGFSWSYSATPTSGYVTITDGTTTLKWWITEAGPGFIPFALAKRFAKSATVTGTLNNGGGTVEGILTLDAYLDT